MIDISTGGVAGSGAPSPAPVPRSEIQLWPFGHDSARVDHAQAAVIVQLALVDAIGRASTCLV